MLFEAVLEVFIHMLISMCLGPPRIWIICRTFVPNAPWSKYHTVRIGVPVFRPSATVSRIGLMESRVHRHHHCRGGPPPLADTPPLAGWPPHVMDGWGARPLRWLSGVLVLFCLFLLLFEQTPFFLSLQCKRNQLKSKTTNQVGTTVLSAHTSGNGMEVKSFTSIDASSVQTKRLKWGEHPMKWCGSVVDLSAWGGGGFWLGI